MLPCRSDGCGPATPVGRPAGDRGGRKTLRGPGTAGGPGRRLPAALDHAHGVVLGQVDVEAKTSEIPMFATQLDRIDLAGSVITADALRAQRGHAEYLAGKKCPVQPLAPRSQNAKTTLPGPWAKP